MTAGDAWEGARPRRRMLPLVGLVVVALAAGVLTRGIGGLPQDDPDDALVVEEISEPTNAPSPPPPLEEASQVPGEWERMAAGPLAGRVGSAVAWTGAEMMIWAGVGTATYQDGALYDPQRDTWRPMARGPLPPRYGAAAVWDGNEVIVAGGVAVRPNGRPFRPGFGLRDAAAYNPATDTWRRVPKLPFSVTAGRLFADRGRVFVVDAVASSRPVAVLDHGSAMWRLLPAMEWSSSGDETAVGRTGDVLLIWPAGRGDAVAVDLVSQEQTTVMHAAFTTLDDCACRLLAGTTARGDVDAVAYDEVASRWWRRQLGPVQPSYIGASESLLYLVYSPGATRVLERRTGRLLTLPLEPQTLGYEPASVWTGDRLVIWGGIRGVRRRFTSDGMVFTPRL